MLLIGDWGATSSVQDIAVLYDVKNPADAEGRRTCQWQAVRYAVSPGHRYLAGAGRCGGCEPPKASSQILDLQQGKPLRTIPLGEGNRTVTAVSFSPDGKELAVLLSHDASRSRRQLAWPPARRPDFLIARHLMAEVDPLPAAVAGRRQRLADRPAVESASRRDGSQLLTLEHLRDDGGILLGRCPRRRARSEPQVAAGCWPSGARLASGGCRADHPDQVASARTGKSLTTAPAITTRPAPPATAEIETAPSTAQPTAQPRSIAWPADSHDALAKLPRFLRELSPVRAGSPFLAVDRIDKEFAGAGVGPAQRQAHRPREAEPRLQRALSEDGSYLAVGSNVWSVATGQKACSLSELVDLMTLSFVGFIDSHRVLVLSNEGGDKQAAVVDVPVRSNVLEFKVQGQPRVRRSAPAGGTPPRSARRPGRTAPRHAGICPRAEHLLAGQGQALRAARGRGPPPRPGRRDRVPQDGQALAILLKSPAATAGW